jgi:hypothetical protein
MFVSARIAAVAFCGSMLASCGRFKEGNLIGMWRAEDRSTIREIAFRHDHAFTTYYKHKSPDDELAALTNPSVAEDTGEWQLRGNQLSMIFKETNSACLPSSTMLAVMNLGTAAMVLKSDHAANERKCDFFGDTCSFTRIAVPKCAPALTTHDPRSIEKGIIGNWQVHYRTHDCRYLYNQDHSVEVFVDLEGNYVRLLVGTWGIERNALVQDLKRPDLIIEPQREQWTIDGMQRDCFLISDGHSQYTFIRIK